MKSLIFKFSKAIFLVWGVASALATMGIGAFVWQKYAEHSLEKIDVASAHDVRFVLNWCELGEDRIEKVVRSYVSSRSLTGDHLDAYAIKISHLDISELLENDDLRGANWYRGDQTPPILDEAIDFVDGWLWQDRVSWFPKGDDLRSEDYYVYPWSIYTQGIRPSAVKLIFVRPSDNMVFYFSGKV